MPVVLFSQPDNPSFHNLCSSGTTIPPNVHTLLGLGLKFCPTPRYSPNLHTADTRRFQRDSSIKFFFAGSPPMPATKLFLPSKWEPTSAAIAVVFRKRVNEFCHLTQQQFKRPKPYSNNMLCFQKALVNQLKLRDDLLVVKTDKNLGPGIVERDVYIRRALDEHLLDGTTYRQLTRAEATGRMQVVKQLIINFTKTYFEASSTDAKFLRRSLDVQDPFAYFYLIMKVHKTPWTTRPIVSISGSLSHGLGRWLDLQLQQLCTQLPYIFRSSRDVCTSLQHQNTTFPLSPLSTLFTMDAKSMYTNIDTTHALYTIKKFLLSSPMINNTGVNIKATISALTIIMKHNVFVFGDTFWLQTSGTAMGTPPAPMYATLYYLIHELRIIKLFPEISLYGRYIDDGFGCWTPSLDTDVSVDEARWRLFKTAVQGYGRLEWVISDRTRQVNFLDITVMLQEDGQTTTRLYEKALNLYLYLPPHSAHPPGVLKGLVCGMIKRIYQLTSDRRQAMDDVNRFFSRLCARGYTTATLQAIASQEFSRLVNTTATPGNNRNTIANRVFLHVAYHPGGPPASELHKLFQDVLVSPPDDVHVTGIQNMQGYHFPCDRLIVAYHRLRNLGNILSPRILPDSQSCRSVSDTLQLTNITKKTQND